MKQQIWEESIEFNQDASRDEHPSGQQNGRGRKVL
jgi:hypothetical protein